MYVQVPEKEVRACPLLGRSPGTTPVSLLPILRRFLPHVLFDACIVRYTPVWERTGKWPLTH